MEQTPKLNISLNSTTEITCTCGNSTFVEALMLRKASRLLTGTPQDAIVPITVFACSKCGEPLKETMPKELLND
jgi:hypothetical protein